MNELLPPTLLEYKENILHPSAIAMFGENAIRVFDFVLEETGDIQFAADLALVIAREEGRLK